MSAEPTRPIEDRLRAYAQARRGQAPDHFELHPATRRLLQSEVARVHRAALGPEPTPGGVWRWRVFWPRFAVALGLVAVLAVVMIQFRPARQDRSLQLAQQAELDMAPTGRVALSESAPSALDAPRTAKLTARAGSEPALAPTAPPAASARPQLASAAEEKSALALQPAASRRVEAPEVAAAAGAPSQPVLEAPLAQQDRLMMERYGLRRSEPALPQPAAAPNAAPAVTVAEALGRTTAATTLPAPAAETAQAWRFAQVDRYRRNPNSPPRPPVLRSFQVIRQGSRLTIIDADGSVYSGDLQTAGVPTSAAGLGTAGQVTGQPSPGKRLAAAGKPAADASVPKLGTTLSGAGGAASSPTSEIPTDLRFTVTGTHRTTQTRVVFQGVLSEILRQPEAFGLPAAPVPNSQAQAAYQARESAVALPGRLQIKGEAILGETTRLGVEAVRVGD